MHHFIKTAKQHLEKAEFSGFFDVLNQHVPDSQKTQFSQLKREFINGKNSHDFVQRLIAFLQVLQDELPAPQNQQQYRTAFLAKTEIEHADYSHCLRRDFTKTLLLQIFVRPQSINLTAENGMGKMRQLEDIKTIAQQHSIRTALVNLKDFRLRYENFLMDLALQLQLQTTNLSKFEDLLNAIYTETNQEQCLIMIANLEVLNDYKSNDPRYNAKFVASLNNLKNKDKIRLVCASRVWLNEVVFGNETSVLTLHPIELPTTLYDLDIEAEIIRCCPAIQDTQHRQILRERVRGAERPHQLLEHLLAKALSHYRPDGYEALLTQWIKQYGK
jgi:hypothetical protein